MNNKEILFRNMRFSSLDTHKKFKNRLISPLNQIMPLSTIDWVDEALAINLIPLLVFNYFDQDHAFAILRNLLKKLIETSIIDPSIIGICKSDHKDKVKAIEIIFSIKELKIPLRPLLLIEEIMPDSDLWIQNLNLKRDIDDIFILADTVSKSLWHQSLLSTYARWFYLTYLILKDKIRFNSKTIGLANEILQFPNVEDKGKVGAVIRAQEGSFRKLDSLFEDKKEWSLKFWNFLHERTNCFENNTGKDFFAMPKTSVDKVNSARNSLIQHYFSYSQDPHLDKKKLVVFGSALYGLDILKESIVSGISYGIMGRVSVRILTELLINLKFLYKKNDDLLWEKFYDFGQSQAKLIFLKNHNQTDPSITDVNEIYSIASQHKILDLQDAEITSWSDVNLRERAELANIKDSVYDKYYDWTSNFIHSNWAAIFSSEFVYCENPLHKHHFIPKHEKKLLIDSDNDSCMLVDAILDVLAAIYPDFNERVII